MSYAIAEVIYRTPITVELLVGSIVPLGKSSWPG